MSALAHSVLSAGSLASTLTTSMFEKNAAAAAASFLRITVRMRGRYTFERLSNAGWLYLLSPGCWLLNARMESSHDLRRFESMYVVELSKALLARLSQSCSTVATPPSPSPVWAVGARLWRSGSIAIFSPCSAA
jgi:hypothetical protein